MKRTEYYDGQLVFTDALTHSQNSLIASIKEHITDLFDPGTVNGLSVGRSAANAGRAFVSSGVAYDSTGERINVPSTQDLVSYNNGDINVSSGTYAVVARYLETNDGVVGVSIDGTTHAEHIFDSFRLSVKKVGIDTIDSTDVRLANIIITTNGGTFVMDTVGSARDIMSIRVFS